METHGENLERVSSRIAPSVMQFCREHRRFHADELRDHVTAMTGINAPASADRVLRDLRQNKKLNYRVVSRRESLYEVLWVDEPPAPVPLPPSPFDEPVQEVLF